MSPSIWYASRCGIVSDTPGHDDEDRGVLPSPLRGMISHRPRPAMMKVTSSSSSVTPKEMPTLEREKRQALVRVIPSRIAASSTARSMSRRDRNLMQ